MTASDGAQVEQRGPSFHHRGRELAFEVFRVGFEHVLIQIVVAPVDGVLDRAHFLFGFGHTLYVEVGAEAPEQFQQKETTRPDREEYCADSLINPAFVNINLLFPDNGFVYCVDLFLLFFFFGGASVIRWRGHFLEQIQWGLSKQEFCDVSVPAHDGDV